MADRATSDSRAVQDQLDRLAARSHDRDILGFDRIDRLLETLGNPHLRLPPTFHVAGTNGKGSTTAFLRAALESAGLSVHVYTSPHLVRLNERIRVAGQLIGDEELAASLRETVDAVEGNDITFFEAVTVAALLAFSRTPADACIIEVGIGGRLDATNVLREPCSCGIAQLALDHAAFLGDTLEQVAAEKAGIAKPGVPLLSQSYPPTIRQVVSDIARQRGAPYLPQGEAWQYTATGSGLTYRDWQGSIEIPELGLSGDHQARNAALAIAMLRHQRQVDVPEVAIVQGLAAARWPARLQRLGPGPLRDLLPADADLWLDGAHNPAAAAAVAQSISQMVAPERPFHLVLGLLADKDPSGVLQAFAPLHPVVHAVPVTSREIHATSELTALARSLGLKASEQENLGSALLAIGAAGTTTSTFVLIAGSLYLAGEALRMNDELPI